jgi:hypothetical protein
VVVDVEDVEEDVDADLAVDPALVDAEVELVEGGEAGAVAGALHRDVAAVAGVEDPADDGGVGVAGDQAEARADLPVLGELVAGDRGEDVGLVEVEQVGGLVGGVASDAAHERVAEPGEQVAGEGFAQQELAADDVAAAGGGGGLGADAAVRELERRGGARQVPEGLVEAGDLEGDVLGEGLGDAEAGVQGVLEADARVAEDGVEVAGLRGLGVEADAGLEGGVVGDVEGGAQARFDGGAGEGEAVVGEAGAGIQGEAFAEAQGGREVEGGAQQGAAVLGGLLAGERAGAGVAGGADDGGDGEVEGGGDELGADAEAEVAGELAGDLGAAGEGVGDDVEAEGVGDEEGDVVAAVGGGDEELPGAEGLAVDEVGAVEELDGLDAAVVAVSVSFWPAKRSLLRSSEPNTRAENSPPEIG